LKIKDEEKCFKIRVSKKNTDNFLNYTKTAILNIFKNEKHLFNNDFINLFNDEIEFNNYINKYYNIYFKKTKKQIKIFRSIRNLFSNLIESLILIDRILFLNENNLNNSFLFRIFSPNLSPRGINYYILFLIYLGIVLISYK
jgi:hypothetical protein